jgi:hypothetical protein
MSMAQELDAVRNSLENNRAAMTKLGERANPNLNATIERGGTPLLEVESPGSNGGMITEFFKPREY